MAQSQPPAYSREAWEAVTRSMPDHQRSKHPVIGTLQAEHRYMATLVQQLADQLTALEQGDPVDSHILYEVMHYMTHFPDAFHHPREDMVYQRAGELDADIADSVDTLQRDHDYLAKVGNQTLEAIDNWRNGSARAKDVLKPGREYISSLYRHMSTEEKLIFPQIEDLLSAEDWRELEQEELLTPVPDPVFGPKVGREYRKIARKARRSLRRGVEDVTMMEWVGLEAMLEGIEVLSIAVDNGKETVRQRFSEARESNREIFEEAREDGSELLMLPMRCVLNNTNHYIEFLKDCSAIVIDTVSDLSELNQGMRERMRMSRGQASEDSDDTESTDERTVH
jgi:hemerythrin-like domain-containing protein/gas vesicle protein